MNWHTSNYGTRASSLLLVLGIFATMTVLFFRFSEYALPLRPLAQLAVIFGPLGTIYYFSRRFEYCADRVEVEFTGEPEIAIPSLLKVYKAGEIPMHHAKFSEFFMTHPSLARRLDAIARIGQMPAQQLRNLVVDEGVPEIARQDFSRN
jgi:Zn-dependent protease with chaperone function